MIPKNLKTLQTYIKSRIKASIKRGDNYGQERYLNIARDRYYEIIEIDALWEQEENDLSDEEEWLEYSIPLSEYILSEMDKELQKLKKQQFNAVLAKAKVLEAMDKAGLECECTLRDQMKIKVKILGYYQYASIKCNYNKIDEALPIIIQTMLAINDAMHATDAPLISFRN